MVQLNTAVQSTDAAKKANYRRKSN